MVADTGPVNYLILIGLIDLLPQLFQRVILPSAVQEELLDARAPAAVRAWIISAPAWVEIVVAPQPFHTAGLGKGETAAIALAATLQADLLLLDERRDVRVAEQQGLRVTGTWVCSISLRRAA